MANLVIYLHSAICPRKYVLFIFHARKRPFLGQNHLPQAMPHAQADHVVFTSSSSRLAGHGRSRRAPRLAVHVAAQLRGVVDVGHHGGLGALGGNRKPLWKLPSKPNPFTVALTPLILYLDGLGSLVVVCPNPPKRVKIVTGSSQMPFETTLDLRSFHGSEGAKLCGPSVAPAGSTNTCEPGGEFSCQKNKYSSLSTGSGHNNSKIDHMAAPLNSVAGSCPPLVLLLSCCCPSLVLWPR